MIVAGGTYREKCEFPRDNSLFGPGLRGAAAVRDVVAEETELHSFVGENSAKEANRKATTFEFDLRSTEVQDTVCFSYIHNHSNPAIQSNLSSHGRKLGPIKGDAILRFGFVEGSAEVDGNRVVYDPQSPDADHFFENGSRADKLAIVLNIHEARSFTERDSLDVMLDDLTSGEDSADIAVIKCGTNGAIVRSKGETVEIPVYETESVWYIGTGDIFSSIFAAYWAENKRPPAEAAKKASLATAYYCSTRNLPIPVNPMDVEGFAPNSIDPTTREDGPKVYLAAPFFDPGEFWFMEQVEGILSKEGAEVFAPYFEIGHVDDRDDPQAVAKKDLEALEDSDVLLALLMKNDPGTIFEIGYARKHGIPVVAYQIDPDQRDNTMLDGTGCQVYGDLATTVCKALWTA